MTRWNRWWVKSDDQLYFLYNKKESLDKFCNELVYLQTGVIDHLSIVGMKMWLDITRDARFHKSGTNLYAVCMENKYIIEERYDDYALLRLDDVGNTSFVRAYRSLKALINELITDHKTVSAVKGE